MAIPTYHATAADVESEQTLLTKAPAHPWKRLAAGAAVASFVLGCLAATAVQSAPGLRGADLHSSTPLPGDQISLKGRNSKWCLAVEDHTSDKDCNGKGGFFGNTCLVSGTRCAGHCAKRD